MKHVNRHHLAMAPLLSILAMSPAVMEKTFSDRSIASEPVTVPVSTASSGSASTARSAPASKPSSSTTNPSPPPTPVAAGRSASVTVAATTEAASTVSSGAAETVRPAKAARPHRRIEQLAEKVDREALQRDANLTLEQFKEKTDELKAKLILERREFKKDESNKEVVEGQRRKLEGLTQDLLVVEANHKKLKEKDQIPKVDDEASVKIIGDSKDLLEGLLQDLESNELLVDKGTRSSGSRASTSRGRTVEITLSPPRTRSEGTQNRDNDRSEKPEKEECETEERNRLLTRQVEELTRQQTQIMQQMMSMQQMMMMQQQQSQIAHLQQYMFNGPGFNTSPYQYQQPTTAGNWVYYPSGFQPQQPNIFAQPQQGAQQQQGVFPDQMHLQMQPQQPAQMQGQQWGLRPGPSYADPRFQGMPIQTGNFGGDALSYNLGSPGPVQQAPMYGPPAPMFPRG